MFDDQKKIGIMLCGMGALFFFFGVMLFGDTGLLAVGDVLFLVGCFLIAGFNGAKNIFLAKGRLVGSVFFFLGIFFIVVLGWVKLGLLVQAFGFINLFGNFGPMVGGIIASTLRNLPFVGGYVSTVLDHPAFVKVIGHVNFVLQFIISKVGAATEAVSQRYGKV
jgi:hypothetical protein